MAKEIVWNKRAIAKLDEVMDYLLESASEQVARTFYEKVLERIALLSQHSEIGRVSKKKKTVRVYPLDKRYHLYYRVDSRRLIIVYLFDTKQHPNQNPY